MPKQAAMSSNIRTQVGERGFLQAGTPESQLGGSFESLALATLLRTGMSALRAAND